MADQNLEQLQLHCVLKTKIVEGKEFFLSSQVHPRCSKIRERCCVAAFNQKNTKKCEKKEKKVCQYALLVTSGGLTALTSPRPQLSEP